MNPNPAPPPKITRDRQSAWAYLGTNLLVLPGLGSVIGGRKVGYAQMTMAVCGLGLSLVAVAAFLNTWIQESEIWPGWRAVIAGLAGITLFGMSWFWSLWTSVMLIRQRR